jgi:hypothetical protein
VIVSPLLGYCTDSLWPYRLFRYRVMGSWACGSPGRLAPTRLSNAWSSQAPCSSVLRHDYEQRPQAPPSGSSPRAASVLRHDMPSSAALPGRQESSTQAPYSRVQNSAVIISAMIKTSYKRRSHISCVRKAHSLESKTSPLLHHPPSEDASENIKRSFIRPFT